MKRRRYRKKKLPEIPFNATIEALSHDGRGITHVDGKVVFIDGALPGEQVEFVYTDSRRDYAEGRVETLLSRSEDRAEPPCPHYGVCGGCSFQHVSGDAQIRIKQELLQDQFFRIGKISIPELWSPLTGPQLGYRQKARMGTKYVAKKGRVLVGFREKGNPFLADIESCPVMHPSVGTKLMDLSALFGELTIRDKIPQIEVAIGDEDCVLAIRVLDPPTDEDKAKMLAFSQQHQVTLYLQSKGPDSIVPLDADNPLLPSYVLPDQALRLQFRPAMFTQVNSDINRKMINRVLQTLELNKEDSVLDLFCGLGNFTLPMARHAGKVVGVDGDLPLIRHAQENARLNRIENVAYYAADLSRELPQQTWVQRHYNKILLDPSRAGALEVLRYIPAWNPQLIVYVSCNPSTLARDAGVLVNNLGYRLVKAGVMDMFPHTAHVESIALFSK